VATFADSIRALKPDTIWRHNIAGDLQGADNVIDSPALWQIVSANTGRKGFTYTHYPVDNADNVAAIEGANRAGFTVNVSCNSPQEALALHGTISAPIVTIVPSDFWGGSHKVGNIVRCPAETSDTITCLSCQLCQHSERKVIIGFTVHGTQAKKADIIARAA